VKYVRSAFILASLSFLLAPFAWTQGLKEYVQRPDDSYKYDIHSTSQMDTNTVFFIEMTSQTWHGIVWKHWLTIIKPPEVAYPETSLLFITGGDNGDSQPRTNSDEARVLSFVASQQKAVVAILEQVPNQPLFDGLYEDGIISYTFEKSFTEGGDDWPLLLPMVKSAVRAMDTVQAVAKEKFDQKIERFAVSGASKRGWTTWLTAAADSRVVAIAPMVIDVLNMAPQMAHQKKAYGAYSEQVKDYTDRHIQDAMQTPLGQKLLNVVDPYSYRDQLTIPKLVILGTNDEYWTVDSAKFYFNDLKGPKWLHYEPNAKHGLNLNIVPAIMAFFGATLTQKPLPQINWRTLEDGSFETTWDNPAGTAALWQAQSPNRDFRNAQWSSSPLEGSGRATVKIDPPAQGWLAYYVAVSFPPEPGGSVTPYTLCTLTNVVPDKYPVFAAQAETPASAAPTQSQ